MLGALCNVIDGVDSQTNILLVNSVATNVGQLIGSKNVVTMPVSDSAVKTTAAKAGCVINTEIVLQLTDETSMLFSCFDAKEVEYFSVNNWNLFKVQLL